MTSSPMSHAGRVRAHTYRLEAPENVFFWLKILNQINQFLAISEVNFELESNIMVFSTYENVGEIFETLRHRLHRNCRTCGGYFSDRTPGS